MEEAKILRENVKAVEAYLLNLFGKFDLQRQIIQALLERWKEHLEKGRPRVEPFDLKRLCEKLERSGDKDVNVRVEVSRARVRLRDTPQKLRASGYLFEIDIETKNYALKVTPRVDNAEPLRRFWQCHLPEHGAHSSGERPASVIIGVFARLFFNIEDELYIRAPSVNTPDAVEKNSRLGKILSKNKYTPTRLYVSAGEVAAAFSLMKMFDSLGSPAKEARVFSAVVQSNGIILGSGISERNVAEPAFQYSVVPKGIREYGAADMAFTDDWSPSKEWAAHVLLNRWYDDEKDSYVTAIYSGVSQAVEGVCDVLSRAERVRRLLEVVDYNPMATESQLVFRVLLRKTDASRTPTNISVRNGKEFVQVWPRPTVG